MVAKSEPNSAILLEQLRAVIDNPESFADDRQEILGLARKAAAVLESPFETLQRLAYSPVPLVMVRIAQEHGIFKALTETQTPTSTAVLAENTGLNVSVLESILEYLATQHMVDEVSQGQYAATKLSHTLLVPLFVDAVTHFHDDCLPAFGALNYALSHPEDQRTAFEIGQNSSTDFYTWLESHPVQSGAFHRFMEAQFASLPTWLDVVSFSSEFAESAGPDTPVFVDVGGGIGQQCVTLQAKNSTLEGKIVLQDKPAVLAKAITGPQVERMQYDYLTEQPVKGARVYYFRQIFHNNSDEVCKKILASHLPAMNASSVLIIDDKVLPDVKPPGDAGAEYTTGLSLAMLAMFNALERHDGQWRTLLNSAGYEIRDIRKFTHFGDSIIIAVPKQIAGQ